MLSWNPGIDGNSRSLAAFSCSILQSEYNSGDQPFVTSQRELISLSGSWPHPKPAVTQFSSCDFQVQTRPKTCRVTCYAGIKGKFQRIFVFQILNLAALLFVWDIPAHLHFHSSHHPTSSSDGSHHAVSLNHSATSWGIYLVTLSDLSLTPCLSLMLRDAWNGPCRCWCFEPRCCRFPPFHLFSPPLSCLEEERWAPRGWRPPTGYQLCHSVTHSEWLTAEQVTSLGGPSLPVISPSSICHVVTQATTYVLGGKWRK